MLPPDYREGRSQNLHPPRPNADFKWSSLAVKARSPERPLSALSSHRTWRLRTRAVALSQSFCHARNGRSGTRRGIRRRRVFDALAMLLGRRDAGRDARRPWGAETDVSACYLAAAANGCAAAAGRFSLRNPRTCRSAIWICLGFAFHGYRVTWAFGAR